jgi:hypothetical protein
VTKLEPPAFDPNQAIRRRLLGRARALNTEIQSRFRTAAEDLEEERHLGALDGVETEIANLKTLLRLLDT